MNISKYSECCICKDCSLCWENRQERVISTTDICASLLYAIHTYEMHINISDFRHLESALEEELSDSYKPFIKNLNESLHSIVEESL